MSSEEADEDWDDLSREERSRRWRETHDIEAYDLEWEDEAIDTDELDDL